MSENTMKNGSFGRRVKEKYDSLSKKERTAAEYMVEHQDQLIYLTITELAEESHTSEATITRLSNRLGFKGFQALKISAARDLVSETDKNPVSIEEDDSEGVIADKIFKETMDTLTLTRNGLNAATLKQCIDALVGAKRIVIVGNGNSASTAMDAQHKFMRIGLDACAYTDDHMQMIAISSLTERDVVIVISHSGSSINATDALKLANERGCITISITNGGSSPASKIAKLRLYTYSTEIRYRMYALASRIAELALIDTLYAGVSIRLGEQAQKSFEALDEALVVKKH